MRPTEEVKITGIFPVFAFVAPTEVSYQCAFWWDFRRLPQDQDNCSISHTGHPQSCSLYRNVRCILLTFRRDGCLLIPQVYSFTTSILCCQILAITKHILYCSIVDCHIAMYHRLCTYPSWLLRSSRLQLKWLFKQIANLWWQARVHMIVYTPNIVIHVILSLCLSIV